MARGVSKNSTSSRRVNRTKLIVSVVLVGLIITVLAVLFGRADDGQIDVTSVINESNISAQKNAVNGEAPAVPVIDSRPKRLNGGLVGSGKTETVPATESLVEIASTTNNIATSTEETVKDSKSNDEDVIDKSAGPS